MKTEAETRLVLLHTEKCSRRGEGRGTERVLPQHLQEPTLPTPGGLLTPGPIENVCGPQPPGPYLTALAVCGTAHPTCDSNHVYSPATFIPVKDVQGGDTFREGSPNPGLFKHFSKW